MAQQPLAAMPFLLDELLVEILSWVPIESLLRFRSVSKTWNSLIFDPYFVKLHYQRSSQDPHLLLRCNDCTYGEDFGEDKVLATCSVRSLFDNPSSSFDYSSHPDYLFVGSSNGLVCLISHFDGDEFRYYRVRFWNLATRIVSHDSPRLILHSNNYELGFNSVKYGFGYDEWSNTYKVVVVVKDVKSENWEVKVHCLGDTCWRNILTCPVFPILGEADGQLVNGTVNWRAIRDPGLEYELETVALNAIFSYDLNKERHEYLLMPDGLEVSDDPDLGVLKGFLSIYYDHEETNFVIWLMREFGVQKSWTRLLNVTYEHLQFTPDILVNPICLSVNDDILVLVICYLPFRFIYYNRRDNRIDRTEDCNVKVPLYSYDYFQAWFCHIELKDSIS